MNITPEEAQAALENIQQTTTKTRSIFNMWSYYLLVWGVVWTTGFLATQFERQLSALIWIVMVTIGIVGSIMLGLSQARRMRLAPGSQAAILGTRLGIFWGVLYGFAALWMSLFSLNSPQIAILWITVVMFGTIINGVWLQQRLMIGFGMGVTLMSVLGYYLLPQYFYAWAAVFAGLPLAVLGIYLLRQR